MKVYIVMLCDDYEEDMGGCEYIRGVYSSLESMKVDYPDAIPRAGAGIPKYGFQYVYYEMEVKQ